MMSSPGAGLKNSLVTDHRRQAGGGNALRDGRAEGGKALNECCDGNEG